MASPAFIQIGRFGQWVIRLTNQTATRTGTPPAGSLVFTTGSNGGFIESVWGQPLGTNVATCLLMFIKDPITTNYRHCSESQLSSTLAPSSPSKLANVDLTTDLLPTALFPAPTSTGSLFQGCRLGPNTEVYLALDTTVAAGWDIFFNGGDC